MLEPSDIIKIKGIKNEWNKERLHCTHERANAYLPMIDVPIVKVGSICCLSLIISKGLEVIPSRNPVPAAANRRPGLG